jgi:hypothetical protein
MQILSLQRSGGGIELEQPICSVLDVEFEVLKRLAVELEVNVPVDKFLLLSTAIVLRVLELHFQEDRALWANVVKKSAEWLKDIVERGRPNIDGQELMSWAERFVRNMRPRF